MLKTGAVPDKPGRMATLTIIIILEISNFIVIFIFIIIDNVDNVHDKYLAYFDST